MKKGLIAVFALASMAFAVPTFARSNVGFSIFISNAPPAPVVVYREEPRFAYVPESRVYVVDEDDVDYDYFRYGAFFYIYDNGYWYRSHGYRGPFVAIRADYVPRAIFSVSDHEYHWRHHPGWMPPGQAKKVWREDRGWKHGHGHGHGRDGD
jgi:hypothetical protein